MSDPTTTTTTPAPSAPKRARTRAQAAETPAKLPPGRPRILQESRLLTMKVPAGLLARIDAVTPRGDRSAWIREAIEAALARATRKREG